MGTSKIIGSILLVSLILSFTSLLVMGVWNTVLVPACHIGAIDFWDAVSLTGLAWFLIYFPVFMAHPSETQTIPKVETPEKSFPTFKDDEWPKDF